MEMTLRGMRDLQGYVRLCEMGKALKVQRGSTRGTKVPSLLADRKSIHDRYLSVLTEYISGRDVLDLGAKYGTGEEFIQLTDVAVEFTAGVDSRTGIPNPSIHLRYDCDFVPRPSFALLSDKFSLERFMNSIRPDNKETLWRSFINPTVSVHSKAYKTHEFFTVNVNDLRYNTRLRDEHSFVFHRLVYPRPAMMSSGRYVSRYPFSIRTALLSVMDMQPVAADAFESLEINRERPTAAIAHMIAQAEGCPIMIFDPRRLSRENNMTIVLCPKVQGSYSPYRILGEIHFRIKPEGPQVSSVGALRRALVSHSVSFRNNILRGAGSPLLDTSSPFI